MYLKYSKVRDVKSPNRAHVGQDAGLDFFIPNDFAENYELKPGENVLIPSGIKVEVPVGYCFILYNKSGVAAKKCLLVGACVVDSGYSGEVHIDMHNVSNESVYLNPGDKIIQGILLPIVVPTVIEVPEDNLYQDILSLSDRGAGGFGSTNKS